jgi:hypothetical protein
MALTASRTRVHVAPITEAELARVAEFLHAHMNERVAPERWIAAFDAPWEADRPNFGFMLLDGDAVVGAHLAFYSQREIEGRTERFCDLAAWCVLEDYRFYGLRLLKALLAQEGYHFTDLSPSGNVVAINERLGFSFLDATTALVPNLPWPTWPGRSTISSDPTVIERTLAGRDLQLYRDHANAQAARHFVLTHGDEWCYVVIRRERWKRQRGFASVVHVSNPALFVRLARPFGRHLLLRHGIVALLAEDRVAGRPTRLSVRVRPLRQRMFKSPDLAPEYIDYFYSELVCLAW